MKAADVRIGDTYAVRVQPEDIRVEENEDLADSIFSNRNLVHRSIVGYKTDGRAARPRMSLEKQIVTKGLALGTERLPGATFVTMEVEQEIARSSDCPTCGHKEYEFDEVLDMVYDRYPLEVVVPTRRILDEWTAWLAECAAEEFEVEDWIRNRDLGEWKAS